MITEQVVKDTLAKDKMLKCQYETRVRAKELHKKFPLKECNRCKRRFKCFTTKARKFKVTEDMVRWDLYYVFAETREEADELFGDYLGDDDIVKLIDSGGERENLEIEDVDEAQNG